MSGVLAWGYDPDADEWRPIKVSPTGSLYMIETVDALNDVGDVNAPAPADNEALTWDAATSKWIPEAATPGAHATSHEDGGGDEISVAGLSGLLADDQHVLDAEVLLVAADLVHAARHQNGGADEISVAGLSGLLADDQHVLDAEVLAVAAALVHAARHENGGDDEISVAGLSGEPAELTTHKGLESAHHAKFENVVEDTTPQLGGDLDCQGKKLEDILANRFTYATRLNISGGVITVTQALHQVDTEGGAASDDLDTINGSATVNMIVIKAYNGAHTVVVKHNTGNIWLQGKADISLDDLEDGLLLVWMGTKWFDIAAGGAAGATTFLGLTDTPASYVGQALNFLRVNAAVNAVEFQTLLNYIDGTHLAATFGASAVRMLNLVPGVQSGSALNIPNARRSVFNGLINGAPTATTVVYDGDTYEDMFYGMPAYDGVNYWGKIILHNTTRGNSRKIEAVDRATNTITTESSVDDWADNDVITCQSQTNTQDAYFDLDLSDKVTANNPQVMIALTTQDKENTYNVNRQLRIHPYQAYDAGKIAFCLSVLAQDINSVYLPFPIYSQMITVAFLSGFNDCAITIRVREMWEYADT